MDERNLAYALADLLDDAILIAEDGEEITVREYPRHFSDSGMLTMNEGVTLRLNDGSEYQLTVVQSRQADVTTIDEDLFAWDGQSWASDL